METQEVSNGMFYMVLIGSAAGLLLALSLVLFYIRYQRRFILQQARQQKAELEHRQNLLNANIQSQEKERIRISKDLHDHVGSSLSNLRLMATRLTQPGVDVETIKALTEEYKKNIDSVINDVRNISHSLSPAGLELWGFQEAIEEFCDKTATTADIDIQVRDKSEGILKDLPFDAALSLFRIIQELVSNTIKHAGAKKITLTMTTDEDNVWLKYFDNGRGVNLTDGGKPGIGLYNIESRLNMIGGSYELVTASGEGYNFTIKLPKRILSGNNDKA